MARRRSHRRVVSALLGVVPTVRAPRRVRTVVLVFRRARADGRSRATGTCGGVLRIPEPAAAARDPGPVGLIRCHGIPEPAGTAGLSGLPGGASISRLVHAGRVAPTTRGIATPATSGIATPATSGIAAPAC